MLIKKCEGAGLNYYNDYTAFFEFRNDIDNVYGNIEKYNLDKERKTLIVVAGTTSDVLSNKKLNGN